VCTRKKVGQRVIGNTESYISDLDTVTKPRQVLGVITLIKRDETKRNKPYSYKVELEQPVKIGNRIYIVLFLKSRDVVNRPMGLRV
jgi:hypothetical protein